MTEFILINMFLNGSFSLKTSPPKTSEARAVCVAVVHHQRAHCSFRVVCQVVNEQQRQRQHYHAYIEHAQQAARGPSRPGRPHPDVAADALASGTVFVPQLVTLQPHRLLVLLVGREPAEDFAAGGQSRWAPRGQRGGLAAEGAGDVIGPVTPVCRRDEHEVRETLQADGVCAVQHLGCLEDVVIGAVADGALKLTHG